MFEKEEFIRWFKENTPKEGLSENTTFTKQFLIDAWDDGYINGYNKANEWHFVKDGDLPKDEFVDEYIKSRLPSAYKRHYCLYLGDNESVMGKYIRGFFSTVEGRYSLDEVVAWKEIVLPIEIEKIT